jgi:hypothetical protein
VALVATVGVSLGVVVLSATSAPAATCTEVLVVGVRGSGDTPSDWGGYGATAYAAINAFRMSFGPNFVAVPLDYPSLGALKAATDPGAYFGGINEGIDELEALLRARAISCPSQKIVLIGYSQGAAVINRALVELQTQGATPIVERVASVELLADPLRIGTAPYNQGSASSAFNGVFLAMQRFPSDLLPQALRGRARSICAAGDSVCAYNSGSSLPAVAALARGIAIHTSYVRVGTAALAGTQAANAAHEFPVPGSGWTYHVGYVDYGAGSPAASYPGAPQGSPVTIVADPNAVVLPIGTAIQLGCWTEGADIYGAGGYPQDAWYRITSGSDAGDYIYYWFIQESTPSTISTAIPHC